MCGVYTLTLCVYSAQHCIPGTVACETDGCNYGMSTEHPVTVYARMKYKSQMCSMEHPGFAPGALLYTLINNDHLESVRSPCIIASDRALEDVINKRKGMV